MGGGFFAFSMFGGAVRIDDCELGHNFDDITDIGSELGFAFNQVGLRIFDCWCASLGLSFNGFLAWAWQLFLNLKGTT